MTTYEGKDKILDGWNAARIRDTLDERLKKLSDLDPYQDIKSNPNVVWRRVQHYKVSWHTDDKDDDDIFEPKRCFSDVFDTYVNELFIKKEEKNDSEFLLRYHASQKNS